MAAVLGGSVLLVAGGYSGRPRGDLMAYKVPPFVFQAPALDVSAGVTGRGGLWEEVAWSLQMRGEVESSGKNRVFCSIGFLSQGSGRMGWGP